uniref:Histone deacetylase complex subunit SAP30 Sin3 binding domain-containing protein n=1 Tax=Macrostomum lignano TaxID=282301 RepID=A0A1I8FCP7_9PLAT
LNRPGGCPAAIPGAQPGGAGNKARLSCRHGGPRLPASPTKSLLSQQILRHFQSQSQTAAEQQQQQQQQRHVRYLLVWKIAAARMKEGKKKKTDQSGQARTAMPDQLRTCRLPRRPCGNEPKLHGDSLETLWCNDQLLADCERLQRHRLARWTSSWNGQKGRISIVSGRWPRRHRYELTLNGTARREDGRREPPEGGLRREKTRAALKLPRC